MEKHHEPSGYEAEFDDKYDGGNVVLLSAQTSKRLLRQAVATLPTRERRSLGLNHGAGLSGLRLAVITPEP